MTAPLTLSGIAQVLRAADLLVEVRGSEDPAVPGVTADSRAVEPGDLFLAWVGTGRDAHDFVAGAAAAGAAAAVVERHLPDAPVPQLVVRDGRRAAAIAADAVLGSPAKRLEAVGITGTNGKTTTTALLRHLLSADRSTASLGTLGVIGADGRTRPGSEGLTTPGPVELARWLAALADEGVRTVVLEASSHALDQERLAALTFEVAVFTNLTQDHLDYHGGMERYRDAKLRLLELLGPHGTAIVNADDPAWAGIEAPHRIAFTLEGTEDARLRATGIVSRPSGTRFLLSWDGEECAVRLPLVGAFNVENAVAAAGAALALGLPLDVVCGRLESVPQIPGRLEVVAEGPVSVLIDFAHTPDALRNVLTELRKISRGRLIVLFGAGGDRDASKRRPMGEAVAEFADLAVLTSDNPRTEDPEKILDDIAPGLAGVRTLREVDRVRAIHAAIEAADEGDVVVLAGKGHEAYQIVGTRRHAFDEGAIAREALARRGAA